MMRNIDHLLVLFHDRKKASQKALSALEDIDDDCDELGISFVEVKFYVLLIVRFNLNIESLHEL